MSTYNVQWSTIMINILIFVGNIWWLNRQAELKFKSSFLKGVKPPFFLKVKFSQSFLRPLLRTQCGYRTPSPLICLKGPLRPRTCEGGRLIYLFTRRSSFLIGTLLGETMPGNLAKPPGQGSIGTISSLTPLDPLIICVTIWWSTLSYPGSFNISPTQPSIASR